MGIPSYLRWVAKSASKSLISSDEQLPIDILCIDGNPDLYAAHHIVMEKHKEQKCLKSKLDQEIIQLVIERYANEVTKISPTTLYLAIDGVPPRAKIHLQRLRRYHKLALQSEKNRLQQKYNIEEINSWDTSQFTPGTVFMQRLHLELEKAIKGGVFPCEVIYSSHLEPGEGEHKWNAYLRKQSAKTVCFRSNDGDLIVLGNQFPQHQIYVLTTLDEVKVYVDINEMQNQLFLKYKLSQSKKDNIMKDYVFFVNFCGNDFVKAFPFSSMRHRGAFDFVMKTYSHIQKSTRTFLIQDDGTINRSFFIRFIKEFAKVQDRKLAEKYRRAMSFFPKDREPSESPYEDELSHFEHSYFYDPSHPYYDSMFPLFKKINYTKQNYHERYYEHFFRINKIWDRATVCRQYLKSMMFCFNYYTDQVPSWEYCYPYRMAPLPSDLLFFLNKYPNEKIEIKDGSVAYTPLELQMLVLPPSNKILPKKFTELMHQDDLQFYFPSSFELDILQGDKFIYAEPLLPDILNPKTTELILSKVHSIVLTKAEKQRYTNVL